MNNIWVALSWSVAVLPAWLAVQWMRPRLEAYGQLAELAAFAGAWYLIGSVLSGLTRLGLEMAGIPVGPNADPAGELDRTRKLLSAGRIGKAEAELRMAACHIALGRPADALACCDAADAAGARDANREQSRFFRGRALEALGRCDEARSLYLSIFRDESLSRLFRGAARIRAFGIAGSADTSFGGDFAGLLDSADAPGCKPCSGGSVGWTGDELTYLGETLADVGSTSDPALKAEALALLLARAKAGRTRRALQRLRKG